MLQILTLVLAIASCLTSPIFATTERGDHLFQEAGALSVLQEWQALRCSWIAGAAGAAGIQGILGFQVRLASWNIPISLHDGT
jgi:hypothetical protein